MVDSDESKFWKYTGEFFAFIGAFTIVFLLIATLSGNMKWHFGSPKIVSKKMDKINFGGGKPMSVTYKVLTETEVEEVVENQEEFYKNLDRIIKQNGETMETAIFKWDEELEPGETYAANGKVYLYDNGIHLTAEKYPTLDTKFSVLIDEKYSKDIHNDIWDTQRKIEGTKEKFYLTRLDVPNSYKGIYVDVRVGTPDRVEDLTYSWIAKGWATPIVTNHPGHNEALAYAKANKMGMWGGNTTEDKVHEGQDSSFVEIKE